MKPYLSADSVRSLVDAADGRRPPPEPVRWLGVALTRHSLARADRNGGRPNPWLRTLDRIGMGFDSRPDGQGRVRRLR